MLPQYGWEVKQINDDLRHRTGSEYWIDEWWELESAWTPKGLKAFITFLVDLNCISSARKKGEQVWAITASGEAARGDDVSEIFLSLNRGWEKRMPDFLQQLSRLREKQTVEN